MRNLIRDLIIGTCLALIGVMLYDIASMRRSNSFCVLGKWAVVYNDAKLKLMPATIYFLPLSREQEDMLLKQYDKYFFITQ